MKKKIILITSILSLTILPSSCNSTKTEDVLEIETNPNYIYSYNSTFDFSGLVINQVSYKDNQIVSSTRINDYTLYDQNNGINIHSGNTVIEKYDFKVEVKKDGCKSTYFTIQIDGISGYTKSLDSIRITSLPTKTVYNINEEVDYTGLQVMLYSKYDDDTDSSSSMYLTQTIDNYSLSIEKSVDAYSYTFTKAESKKVTVTYQLESGEELSTYFYIKAIKTNSYSPITYTDTTISTIDDTNSMTVTFTNSSSINTSSKGYYSPDEINDLFYMEDFSNKNLYQHFTPSIGKVPLLVVPVVFPGYESQANQDNLDKISTAFFGNSSDVYFESLHSYYYKSSYGQLDFTGSVLPYMNLIDYGYSSTSDVEADTNAVNNIGVFARRYALSLGYDLTQYDSNNDGFIDGIWMIYIGPERNSSNTLYWAYTTSNTSTSFNITNPNIQTYAWANIDFITNMSNDGNYGQDSHVIIHETGHMLGLNDYYSYGNSGTYSPLGGIDMMDNNVGDQNPYSKLLLGWIKPYIVYGNCTITIKSCQYKDNVILIPYNREYITDSKNKVSFNLFDEYLVLDLYNSNNLNEQNYAAYNVSTIKATGGRLYHIDNRLGKVKKANNAYKADGISTGDDLFTYTGLLTDVITNTESGSRAESNSGFSGLSNYYDEIRWINKSGVKFDYYNRPNKQSLFYQGDSFDINSYKNQFNNGTFDNKLSFSTSFTIDSIN